MLVQRAALGPSFAHSRCPHRQDMPQWRHGTKRGNAFVETQGIAFFHAQGTSSGKSCLQETHATTARWAAGEKTSELKPSVTLLKPFSSGYSQKNLGSHVCVEKLHEMKGDKNSRQNKETQAGKKQKDKTYFAEIPQKISENIIHT